MIYFHTELHVHNSIGLLIIAFKLKANWKFSHSCHVVSFTTKNLL